MQLASGRLAEVLQAWRGDRDVGEEIHGFEFAEPGKHEPVGLVSVGVAQPLHVRGVVGVSKAGDVVPRGGGVAFCLHVSK